MREVFVVSDNILSPLGSTSAENFAQLTKGISGIKQHKNSALANYPFYAALFDEASLPQINSKSFTKFERIVIASIDNAIYNSGLDPKNKETIFILSSTKGNISLIETEAFTPDLQEKISLHHSAELIAKHFGFSNRPVVVSHACISGLLALILGMRLIQSGQFKNAVIAGGDIITKFILSGFQAFQAISAEPCKPFDANRNGISLGEGASTLILSSDRKYSGSSIKIISGSVSNDANHISGPSRTGEELWLAIRRSMKDADLVMSDIDFISAHGTATIYNDDMEAKAITLAGMQSTPVNSLKGYYGHTLGAAGLIESVISIHSLKENIFLPTLGYKEPGTVEPINVCKTLQTGLFKNCLKTASGFGGCNAAIVMAKQA